MSDGRLQTVFLAISAIGTLILVFISLPQAIDNWIPFLTTTTDRIPPTVFNWIQNILLAAFGFATGWIVHSKYYSTKNAEQTDNPSPSNNPSPSKDSTIDSIEGCIETDGVLWRGNAKISGKEITEINVPYQAYCPKCKTLMYDGENKNVGVVTTATTYWDCPSCSHTTVEKYSKYEAAENLFKTHISRIVESEGEDYSLDSLVENITAVTPRKIWEEYYDKTDNSDVSIDCFH